MTVGVQVFNANGTLRDDITTRMGRVLHSQFIPEWTAASPDANPSQVYPSGAFDVPGIAGWMPYYFCTPGTRWVYYPPRVTISGTTVTWDFGDMAGSYVERMIMYEMTPGIPHGGIWLHVGAY